MTTKKTLNEIIKYSKLKNIKCLSKEYINSKSKLLWECGLRHKWQSTYQNVFNKNIPCPKCRGRNIYNLELCIETAKNRNGKCLSKEYLGGHVKLKWQCEKGHVWETTPYAVILNKTWCCKCSFIKLAEERKFSIDIAKEIAEKKGGELVSNEYKNSDTKMEWKCSNGYIFHNNLYHIKQRNQWCPKCIGKNITIEEVKEFATKRGGKCLSDQYVNTETKMLWECSMGHRWEAYFNGMKGGKWCPICSKGIGEEICRDYFKKIFKKEFPSSYPPWLKNKNRQQLELDGYCQELGIAFEHQGRQHYNQELFFHKNKADLLKLQHHDQLKLNLCEQYNVKLIQIPDVLYFIGIDKIEVFLKDVFKKQNIIYPHFDKIKIDINKLYNKQVLEKYKKIAKEKRGQCISEQYINMQNKLKFQCKEGHVWESLPQPIEKGSWCPYCYGRYISLEDVQKVAISKGGKLISKKYINNSKKLIWECSKGHRWNASFSSIQPRKSSYNKGSWCPICHGTPKKTIKEMKLIAKMKGGKCLSKIYIGANSKLKWECDNGHLWEATPSSIINGKSWCPICSRENARIKKIKYSLEDMIYFARNKEGDCLSEKYISYTEKLIWICKYDHQWAATPKNIFKGRWCPECAKKNRIKTRYGKHHGRVYTSPSL